MRIIDRLGWLLAGVLSVFVAATAADLARGGPLDPAGAPSSTMKTLGDVLPSWNRVLPATGTDPCNTERFDCVLGDQAVLDRETGLVWDRTVRSERSWGVAVATCQVALVVGDRQGWRLPTIPELMSLIGVGFPAGHPFNGLPANKFLWSATTTTDDPAGALIGSVGGGFGGINKSDLRETLCVRGPGEIQAHVDAPLEQTPSVVPLCRWFSPSRGDYHTTTSCDAAPAPDYGTKAMQGVLIDPLLPDVPDTIPVYLWFSATRGDYFITTLDTWDPTIGSAAHDTYEFVATIGRLYEFDAAGRCALNGFFNSGPQDNLAQAENQATPAGYGFSRTHGYMPGACP